MKTQIKIFKTTDDLAKFFVDHMAAAIRELPSGDFFSLAVSGGSTPKAVFEYMSQNSDEKFPWEKVKIFWGDERCVSPENPESNFKMTKESLLDKLPIPSKNIFRIKGEEEPQMEAKRYSKIVGNNVFAVNNIPRFDLIMLGLGEDGHTASIFPDQLQLFSSEELFEEAVNPYSKQKRITATGKLINNAKTILFLATGKSKAEMVANIIERKKGWEILPAAFVHPSDGEVIWLLDEESAALLERE